LSKKGDFFKAINGKRLRVMNREYKVRVADIIREGNLYGLTSHVKERIDISRSQSLHSARDTLLHEVMHAIWHTECMEYGIRGEDAEEYLVTAMSSGIMAVTENNPWLVEVLWNREI